MDFFCHSHDGQEEKHISKKCLLQELQIQSWSI